VSELPCRYVTVGKGRRVHILASLQASYGWTLCGLYADGVIGLAAASPRITSEDVCRSCLREADRPLHQRHQRKDRA